MVEVDPSGTVKRNVKAKSPLVAIVARGLRGAILSGELSADKPLPSERTLAERFSVSRTVVREAMAILAEEGLLLQSDRCRPVVAGNAPMRRSRTATRFGVWLWPQADDYCAASIFRGIQQAARGTDLRLVVGTASHASWDDDIESEARFIRGLVEDEGADGLIIWYLGGPRNLPVLRAARAKGLEFVFVDRLPPKGFDADFIGTENVGASKNGVSHLIALGHRRIAFVGNLDTASTVRDRFLGYRRALEDAGIEMPPGYELHFSPYEGEADHDAARRTALEIVALDPPPTAIFAVNDSVGLDLIRAFRELGVKVPEELSIVGFDGLLHWVPGGGPITTVRQSFSTIGEMAGAALIARLSTESPSTFRHVLLDAPLSLGGSTAAPRRVPDLNAPHLGINP